MLCKYCGTAFKNIPGSTKQYCNDSCREMARKLRKRTSENLRKARQAAEEMSAALDRKPEPAQSEPVSQLFDISEFGDAANAQIDPIRDITWIYNNLDVKNVKPSDAPSSGAYAHLKHIQSSLENRQDFLKSVYPRLIPAKSQLDGKDKFNDDNRAIFDILERLQKECAVSTS